MHDLVSDMVRLILDHDIHFVAGDLVVPSRRILPFFNPPDAAANPGRGRLDWLRSDSRS
jgi:hypothetical protein